MASYIKFELEDGTSVYLETADVPKGASGFPLGSSGEHPSKQQAVSFETSIQSVRKMAAVLIHELRDGLPQTPDEMQVNFAVKAAAEVGSLVVARGGMEANFSVMLRWHNKDKESGAGAKESGAKEEGAKDATAGSEAQAGAESSSTQDAGEAGEGASAA